MYQLQAKKRINSRKYSTIKEYKTDDEVLELFKADENLKIHIPYVFTCIQLSNGQIITQTDDHFGLTCSPQRLVKLLENIGVKNY